MSLVNLEGKDEKLTVEIRPLEIKLDPQLESAIARVLNAFADFLNWVRRAG